MSLVVIDQGIENGVKREGYSKLLPENAFHQLIEMNNSKSDIEMWHRRNIWLTVSIFLIFSLLSFFTTFWFAILGAFFSTVYYHNQMKSVRVSYNQFRFERQFQFTKFTQLIIPLLKQSSGNINLRAVFDKIVPRMDFDIDRKILQRLMSDMSYYNNSYYAFDMFAKQMSGTDTSYLFMSTLADLNNGALDLKVIDELGKLSSDEMMKGMDQIIDYKVRKFNGTYGKMVGSMILIILGFSIAVVIYQIGNLGLFV